MGTVQALQWAGAAAMLYGLTDVFARTLPVQAAVKDTVVPYLLAEGPDGQLGYLRRQLGAGAR